MRTWNALGLICLAGITAEAVAQDSRTLPGEAGVVVEADDIENDDVNNQIIATGDVVVEYEGRILRADRLTYNLTSRRIYAVGNVQIFDPDGTERFADEIEVDENLIDGYASNFSTRLPTGATAIARSAVREASGINALDKVIYTACEVCEEAGETPTWSLRARRAVLNQETQMISYRDAVLEVAGIPVLYLPYFTHPDPQSERRSGLLVPGFGASSKLGAFYQQPYYWAISPSSDLTIAPAVYGNVNPLLEIDYRKRFYSGQLRVNASGTNEKEFDSDGEKFGEQAWRSHLFAEGRFAITPTWNWGFGAEYMSDDLYSRRYDIEGENEERGLYESQLRQLLSQVFLQGQGDDFYADAAVFKVQSLKGGEDDATLPVATPLAFAERTLDFRSGGQLAVNVSTAILGRDEGADSRRVSLGADWQASRILPGGFVAEPFAEIRGDYYGLDEEISGQGDVTRAVGSVGARLSWPLVRHGESVDVLIEPTALVAYGTPEPNDEPIPIEDDGLFELDEASLFSASAAPGYDLYEGGGKAAFGISSTANWRSGLQARVAAGVRWRDEADPAFTALSGIEESRSDYIATAAVNYDRTFKLSGAVRLDNEDLELNQLDLRASVNTERLRAAIRYYAIDESVAPLERRDEGFDASAELRLTQNWSLTYNQLRDVAGTEIVLRDPLTDQILRDPVTNERLTDSRPRNIRQSFGIAWTDECSRFEIAYERKEAVDRSIGPSESIQFRFFLLSLGTVGDRDFD
jgi:LPS-assembly protein